jgi:CDP-paratose 2-epimerase
LRVLVTGGSGYLGLHVRGFLGADDFSRRSGSNVLNPEDSARVADYDVIVHLAAHLDKSPEAAEDCFRTNAEGTANIIRHMQPNSAFIYASTKDVYGSFADAYTEVPETCRTDYSGQSPLEWSKLIGERYVEYYGRARNVRTCIFRMSTVYARPSDDNQSGVITHYVESVKRGLPIRLPLEGKPVRDVLHVDDFSRACRAFIDSNVPHGLYNIGGGRANAAPLREIIDKVGRLIQCEPVIDENEHLPAPTPINYISDITRIRADLGWEPSVGIEDGLRSLL